MVNVLIREVNGRTVKVIHTDYILTTVLIISKEVEF